MSLFELTWEYLTTSSSWTGTADCSTGWPSSCC